ncbi:hypothetical protein FQR65_LT02649 [Abscondita terminalis]|nr:hypothetical protein FQR65_LT02649 [Abscondita terminalis]
MALKVVINYLSKEELAYEVEVRGADVGTVEEMRKSLTSLLKIEKTDPKVIDSYPDYQFTEESDTQAVEASLVAIQNLIDKFDGGNSRKIESKLWHVLGRLRRMNDLSAIRVDLLKKALSLKDKFQVCVSSAVKPAELDALEASLNISLSLDPAGSSTPRKNLPLISAVQTTPKSIPVYKWDVKFSGRPESSVSAFLERVDELASARSVSMEQDKFQVCVSSAVKPAELDALEASLNISLSLDPAGSSTPRKNLPLISAVQTTPKSIPVYKWDVKFSGRPESSVSAFLERVDELASARSVSMEQVFTSALDLFEGPALNWYRSVRKSLSCLTFNN